MRIGRKFRLLDYYKVEEAGAQIGLSRAGAYRAASNGDIPTVRQGRFLYVPRRPWDRKRRRMSALTQENATPN
jgi:hypothetical protein